jgi:membrane dipeptidase
MASEDRYDGYESFEYLEAGADYTAYDLPEEMNVGGPPYEVPLSDTDEQRAEAISDEQLVISAHEHPVKFVPTDPDEVFDYTREGRTVTPYRFLSRSNLDAIFDFHLDGSTRAHSKSGWKFSEVVHDLGMRASDIAHQEFVLRAGSVEDVEHAHETGKLALIPAMESSMMIENELDRIDVLHGLGVRLMGVAYSSSNALATGLGDMNPNDGGLTTFGHDAVDRMNKLGMLVSVSHSSDQTALDVAEASGDPILLTHDGARALNGTARLKPDECLEAVAGTGGVIGVQAAPHGTVSYDHPEHTIEAVMDHFEYLVDLVGIDHVTFGTDTLYGDHREFHRIFGSTVPDMAEEVEYVKGMENPTEAWHNIVRWLVTNGYSDEEIRNVLGGNVLRVMEAVWP